MWAYLKRISCGALIVLLIGALTSCTPKDAEAAKRIEDYLQQQEQQSQSFMNIAIDKLDSQKAMELIKELASEKYKGRKTGTRENKMAAQYISAYFKEIGLQNPPGLKDYLQPYTQPITLLKDTPKLEIVDKDQALIKSYEYPKNFVFRVLSDKTKDIKLNNPMQIMGSAAELKEQQFKDNKVLLFSASAQGRSTMMQLMREAYPTGASAVILEIDVDSENSHYSDLVISTLNFRQWGAQYIPVITVDSQTFAELSASAKEGNNIKLECSYETDENFKTNNIIGYIPGSDEKQKDEYIIIGGHMDHVGDNLNGTYNSGAFDNASGTAAVAEIARVISQNPIKPKKTVIFIAFNGEEYGMNGSSYYADNPVFPLENAVMINMDMVGSSYKIPLSVANNGAFVMDLKLEFLELAELLGIEAEASMTSASDHFYFGDKGVPSVCLIHYDDMHGYHSPNDTLEDVDPERLKDVMKLVLYYIEKKAY